MSEWQKIESAPRDGTRILLWPRIIRHRGRHYGQRRPEIGYWWTHADRTGSWVGAGKPTHWMHLPPPPSSRDQET